MILSDIRDIITKPDSQFDTIGSFILSCSEDIIYEGLIKSYPIEAIIKAVYSQIQPNRRIVAEYIDKDKLFNSFTLIIEKNFSQIDIESILHSGEVYGWVIPIILFCNKDNQKLIQLSKNDITKINFIEAITDNVDNIRIKFEAKFDVELEKKNWPEQLFCLAPKNVKAKIEKIGLVPKAGKNIDHNQSRIYFAFDKFDLLNEMLPQLKRYNPSYKDGYVLITLDTSKFLSNVRLFQDINWPRKAVYTLVNIPQKSFIDISTQQESL